MKKLRTSLCTAVLAASVCLVAQRPVSAQEPTPSPQPSPSPPALINGEPTAAIADAAVTEEEPEKVHSKKGKFPPVAVPAEEIMTVQLRFRLELAGALLILQPLDGGCFGGGNFDWRGWHRFG